MIERFDKLSPFFIFTRPKVTWKKPKNVEVIKIILMGNPKTGKSCLSSTFCEGQFIKRYDPTVAIDYHNKITKLKGKYVNVNSNILINNSKINLWDFSGFKEFLEVRNEFYKEAHSIILMYDTTNRKSFDGLDSWLREAKKCGIEKPLICVCGTKKDLTGRRAVAESEGKGWASQRKYRFFETSSKENKGINEMFIEIISQCLR